VGGATATTGNAPRRRVAVVLFALSALVGAASIAEAQTPIETARERAARLGQQVVDAHASVADLQHRIMSLASDVTAARRSLDHLQGRLVEAEHDLARARAEAEAVEARLNERARQAFMTSGPGASAAYLLEADSFADLMDRTVMLDSVQRADTLLGA
jgi:peptidoglycan hydrolase CwlO-like protein